MSLYLRYVVLRNPLRKGRYRTLSWGMSRYDELIPLSQTIWSSCYSATNISTLQVELVFPRITSSVEEMLCGCVEELSSCCNADGTYWGLKLTLVLQEMVAYWVLLAPCFTDCFFFFSTKTKPFLRHMPIFGNCYFTALAASMEYYSLPPLNFLLLFCQHISYADGGIIRLHIYTFIISTRFQDVIRDNVYSSSICYIARGTVGDR